MVVGSCSVVGSVVFQSNTQRYSFYLGRTSSSSLVIESMFVGSVEKRLGWLRPSAIALLITPSASGSTCWFKFGKNGVDAEQAGIYGSQSCNDFNRDDVEQYFNYMGMLVVEGTYDKMEGLLSQNIHPVDILLILAATEGDKTKIEELLRAGADYIVKDIDGRTAIDRAITPEIKDNMTRVLKKLGEANTDLKLDIGDFCAIVSSDQDQDDNGTHVTQGGATP